MERARALRLDRRTGTGGYVVPATRVVAVWLAQVELQGPDDLPGEFLTLAATAA